VFGSSPLFRNVEKILDNFVILSEAKNLKLLIINALDSSLRSESLKSESFSEFNGIPKGNS
jgi:hypothetical protein